MLTSRRAGLEDLSVRRWAVIVTLLLGGLALPAPAADAVTLPAKEKFHLFLLVGQSNMAGRGKVEPEDQVPNPRVLTLTKEGTWVPAVDPIHFDKPAAGVGPGRSFGLALAEQNPDITVGLIPCAAGGSPIGVWVPGGVWEQTKSKPYDDAIARAKRALQDGVLKGILWHQGEADSSPAKAAAYGEALEALIKRFRTELNAPEVPVVIGQLGQAPSKCWGPGAQTLTANERALTERVPNTVLVPSDGLTFNEDKVHFDAASQRTFGKRYAEAYLKLVAPK